MNTLSVTTLLAVLLFASSPARGKSPATFSKAQTFQSCSETTVFACNKISSTGQRYGTAHSRTMCSQYDFRADGTVNLMDYMGIPEAGRYRIKGNVVFIERLDDNGKVASKFSLTLSKDGENLDKMKRIDATDEK